MSWFDDETAIHARADGRWACRVHPTWNIGDTPNGGYALLPVLRALGSLSGHPDPLTVTAHFLRPASADADGTIEGRAVRSGRSTGTATASLVQDGTERLLAVAAFGRFGVRADPSDFEVAPPADLAEPAACVGPTGLEEGIDLAIASRVEVRVDPRCAIPGGAPTARIDGWIRFADGAPPTALALPLFADAFPPSLYARLGRIGWIPTIELTVQIRRHPVPGWIQARFECDDVIDGRMVETGTLWDEGGHVVARSRQLGLLLRG